MCRLFSYLGPPRSLGALLVDPAHGLRSQVRRPRRQAVGHDNPDGFGVGWYDRPGDPARRLRRDRALDLDADFDRLAESTVAPAMLAAIRNATPPLPVAEVNSAPFRAGPWLFAHNGSIEGFTEGVGLPLRAKVSVARAAAIEGDTDSEVFWALVLDAIDAGQDPADALVGAIDTIETVTRGRLTCVLTDGSALYAATRGNGLWTLHNAGLAAGGVIVASEPSDDDPAWSEVPDDHLVVATPAQLTLSPIPTRGATFR